MVSLSWIIWVFVGVTATSAFSFMTYLINTHANMGRHGYDEKFQRSKGVSYGVVVGLIIISVWLCITIIALYPTETAKVVIG